MGLKINLSRPRISLMPRVSPMPKLLRLSGVMLAGAVIASPACSSKKAEVPPPPLTQKDCPPAPRQAPVAKAPQIPCDEQRPHLGIVRITKFGDRVRKDKPVVLKQGGRGRTIKITTKASELQEAHKANIRLVFTNPANGEKVSITQNGDLKFNEVLKLSKTESIVAITVKIQADESIPAGKYNAVILFKTQIKGKEVEIPIGVKLEAIEVKRSGRGKGRTHRKGPCAGKKGVFYSACMKRHNRKGHKAPRITPRPRTRKSSNPCKGKSGVFLSACKKRFGLK